MKKKHLTVGLLVIASVVWGAIIYKIFDRIDAPTPEISKVPILTNGAELEGLDTFVVSAYSRDPFLSILTDTAVKVAYETPSIVQQIQEETLVLPEYCGLITSGRTKTAIVKWKKKFENIQVGQSLDQFLIKSISENQIVVITQGKRITIPLIKSY